MDSSIPKASTFGGEDGSSMQMDRSLKRKSEEAASDSSRAPSSKGRQRAVGLANALSTNSDTGDSRHSRTSMDEDSAQGSGKDVDLEGSHHSPQPSTSSKNRSSEASRERKRTRSESGGNQRTEEEDADGEDEEDTMKDTENESSEEEDEDMESEEDKQEMESLEYVQQYVRSLEPDRTVELEVRLAHHKHLRNLRTTTKVEDNISMENRFEILKKERELNEFYAAQYSMKTKIEKNRITVDTNSYEQRFTWPKSYAEPETERRSKKNKKENKQGSTGEHLQNTSFPTAEDESVEDLRRHAAILEAHVNVLRDQNRELDDQCITLKDVAGGGYKEIEAAAKLYARTSPRRRTIIPYRWNDNFGTWEVAYHKSNELISVPDQDCTQYILRELISDGIPTDMKILGSKKEGMEEWRDQENDCLLYTSRCV
ncbi:hypothetical protein CBR_g50429 [Chara braunii]|uniref:Uncharacterized protein n=1 Tax=Chara braunii TaxID=69332 RepID=A0A388M6S0_CHABU|nr:hypothetical protein CBR_g50429 [Chara braunii]|eukprot:GBG90251.1 hypothetical protein CBR_g50429 [Chara braunii]